MLACASVACASVDATPMVRARAADDLTCPESTLRVRRDYSGTYTALGCGKRATYRSVCEGTRCALAREGESLQGVPLSTPPPEPVGGRP